MDDLPSAEQARVRRRDRDMSAEERALMNNASHKWFQQVLEKQRAGAAKKRRKQKRKR